MTWAGQGCPSLLGVSFDCFPNGSPAVLYFPDLVVPTLFHPPITALAPCLTPLSRPPVPSSAFLGAEMYCMDGSCPKLLPLELAVSQLTDGGHQWQFAGGSDQLPTAPELIAKCLWFNIN